MITKWISWGLSILLFILSLFGFQTGGGEKTELLTYNDAHTALTVTLSENPSTGYGWNCLISNADVLHVTENTFTPGESGLPGAPGTRAVTLEGAAEGTALVTFTYVRPWEEEPAETVVIRCVVSGDRTIEAEVIG